MQRAGASQRVLVIDHIARPVGRLEERPLRGIEPELESLGCHAVRAASTEHLSHSVRSALAAERPTLIEVREDSAWLRA